MEPLNTDTKDYGDSVNCAGEVFAEHGDFICQIYLGGIREIPPVFLGRAWR